MSFEEVKSVSPDEFYKCKRKVRYGHKETADRALEAMVAKYGRDTLEVYECPYCQGFHLGHPWTKFLVMFVQGVDV